VVYDKLLSQVADLPRQPALLGHFLLAKKVEGRSPRTLEWYQEAFQAFERFCSCQGFDADPTKVTPLHIRTWLAHIQDADFGEIGHQSRSKPATVSAKSATLCGLGWNSTELKLV